MTIQSTDRKAGPFLSGTALPFGFKVFSKEDIAVIYTTALGVPAVLVLDSDYSVSLNADQDNNPGGTATLTTPIVSGDRANIIGDLAYDQGTDIRNQGGFEPEIIEDALDRATIQIQQLKEISDRTLKTAPGDSRTGDELLADIFEAEENSAASAAAAEESANRVDLGALDDAVAQTQSDVVTTTTQAGIATTQAGIATVQAGTATNKASESNLNADRAEAARDSTFFNAGRTFTSVALGLAGSTDGQQFAVVEGDYVQIYTRTDSVTATIVVGAKYPTAALIPLLRLAPDGYALAFVDGYGLVSLGIKDDGTVQIASINGKNVNQWIEETSQAGALIGQSVTGYQFAIVDQFGRAAAGIKDDGTLATARLETTFLNGVSVSSIINGSGGASENYRGRFPSEINMVLSYGQSLAEGADGVPPITTTQRFDNLRFEGGVRSQDSGTPYTALVPLIETQSGDKGETPIAGATDMIKELVFAEDGLEFSDHSFQLLGSAPGASGSAISQLISGTSPFARFVANVQNGYTLSQAAGKSFKVGAFFWSQGESDYIGSTPKATYKAAFVQLRNDLEDEVQAITGQSEPLVCISYQVQGHATYGFANNPYLAVAQLEVAKENPHHYVACPLYWSQQPVHQSALNYKRLGAYYGLAYKRIVIDGEDWMPVMPVQIDRQGTIILARFNVPDGPLVFDNVLYPARTNFGFSVVNSGGSSVAVSSVELVGPDTVKIVTSTAAAGGRLRYGFTNGGNLRDSQGDNIIFDGGGLNFPMHNWCVIFDELLN